MTDSDGNPKCLSKVNILNEMIRDAVVLKHYSLEKICWGGKIPEELYTDKNDSLTNSDDFVDTTVKKGGKIKVALNCEENNFLLK